MMTIIVYSVSFYVFTLISGKMVYFIWQLKGNNLIYGIGVKHSMKKLKGQQ